MFRFLFIVSLLISFNVLHSKDNIDSTIKDLFCEKIEKEKEIIKKNKIILTRTENELYSKVKNGMKEQEFCIRDGLGALKTIDYAYFSILDKIDKMDCYKISVKAFNELERIRKVNRLFGDINLKIEECLLKNSVARRIGTNNEMIQDDVSEKKELINMDINVPEDYPAARSPFR